MKKGDVIICIDEIKCFSVEGVIPSLTLYKAYIVVDEETGQRVRIIDDDNRSVPYIKQRFITLQESRKLKLKKIISVDQPI